MVNVEKEITYEGYKDFIHQQPFPFLQPCPFLAFNASDAVLMAYTCDSAIIIAAIATIMHNRDFVDDPFALVEE